MRFKATIAPVHFTMDPTVTMKGGIRTALHKDHGLRPTPPDNLTILQSLWILIEPEPIDSEEEDEGIKTTKGGSLP